MLQVFKREMDPKKREMEMPEKSHIISILNKTKKAIRGGDTTTLKELSNKTIHTASIYQDPGNITLAVLIYALSKIFERANYRFYSEWQFFSKACLTALDNAIKDVQENDVLKFKKDLMSIRTAINKMSGNLKIYIESVFRKAMINKASRLYEHGISVEQTAELLGISVFELAEYTGKTGISDVNLSITLDINSRIKKAFQLFEK